jgi:hypothetical protein
MLIPQTSVLWREEIFRNYLAKVTGSSWCVVFGMLEVYVVEHWLRFEDVRKPFML